MPPIPRVLNIKKKIQKFKRISVFCATEITLVLLLWGNDIEYFRRIRS